MRRLLVVLVLGTSLAANVAWSPSPIGAKYDTGIWAKAQSKHVAANQALTLVPPGAGVSATYYLVPHLTHRARIYEFPNPWVVTNWGARGENPPDPAGVDYLVLDTSLNGDQQPLYDRLVRAGGQFKIIYQVDEIVVARRVAPG